MSSSSSSVPKKQLARTGTLVVNSQKTYTSEEIAQLFVRVAAIEAYLEDVTCDELSGEEETDGAIWPTQEC